MAGNPKLTFKNKPTFAVRAHATMRLHDKRIEIGFRIPPDMEKHLFKFLLTKPHLRALAPNKAKATRVR
jgi:hypothetical protein